MKNPVRLQFCFSNSNNFWWKSHSAYIFNKFIFVLNDTSDVHMEHDTKLSLVNTS